MPIVELRNVSKTYRDPGSGQPVPVLSAVNLTIEPGESIAIVGPSGCGKSTLLNILGTLDVPDSGEYVLDGQPIQWASPASLSALRSEKIGFIFQMHHLLPQCTVLENVLLPTLALAEKPDPAFAKTAALDLLKAVGLEDRATWKPGQLSGGERQRVAVVRALINGPSIVLADEPTGALDEKNAANLTQMMNDLVKKSGITLVLVTHQPSQAEQMQKIYRLHEGALRLT